MAESPTRAGLSYALLAYGLWGGLTLFWKALAQVPASEQLMHRIVGAALLMLALIVIRGELPTLAALIRDRTRRRRLALSATLLGLNWFVFLLAVETDRVLHASLGYYINPILSVVLGMVVLGERLRRLQWAALGCASVGVLTLVWRGGELPWIGLVLAAAFGGYGLLRKTIEVEPLPGSTLEALILAPPCLAGIAWLELGTGTGHLVSAGPTTTTLLALTGLVTAVPLLCFTAAARRLPLYALGFMQYITPTAQFLFAVFVFDETFTQAHAVAFGAIWAGVALFATDLAVERRRTAALLSS